MERQGEPEREVDGQVEPVEGRVKFDNFSVTNVSHGHVLMVTSNLLQPDYNEGRCTKDESKCTHRKYHLCNFRMPNNKGCGKPHPRIKCPHRK